MNETSSIVSVHQNSSAVAPAMAPLPGPEPQQERPLSQVSLVFEYWRIINKRKGVVLAVILATVAVVTVLTLRMTRLYMATAKVNIARENPDLLNLNQGSSTSTEDWDYEVALATQKEILTSDAVGMQVIQKLDLAAKRDFAGKWTSSDRTQPDARRDAELLRLFRKNMEVKLLPRTRILEVRFLNPDPKLAAEIANTVVNTYIEQNFRTKYESAMQTTDWLSRQLSDLKVKVEMSQEKLAAYQKEAGILGSDEKQNIITAKLDELNRAVTEAETDRIAKESRYRTAQAGRADLIARSDESNIDKLRDRESELRTLAAQVSTQFGPSYPKVQEIRNQLRDVAQQLAQETQRLSARFESEYRAALRRENLLRASLETQKQEANKLNESAVKYQTLKRELDSNRQLYEGLLTRMKEASVTAGLRSNNIRLVDAARVPVRPSKPNLPRNMSLALLLGLVGGVGMAFALHAMDTKIHTPEHVEAATRLPLLGAIPIGRAAVLDAATGGKALVTAAGNESPEDIAIVTQLKPKSVMSEAYRSLRTSILLSSFNRNRKVLLLTSSMPKEGKSTTALNTAIVMAQRGERVLLVDADLRRPSVHKLLKLPNEVGLSGLIAGTNTEEEVTQPFAEVPSLSVITAGAIPPYPAEMLGSAKMRELIATWRKEYDRVIIDTPPVLSVTDAVLMSVAADAVVLVVRAGYSPKVAVRRTCELLAQVSAPLLGVVVNALDVKSPDSYYYYHRSYSEGYHSNET